MHSSNQTVKVNQLITIFLGATLVAANSSPTDLGTFAGPNDLSSGVTSFALPAEERMNEIYTLAVINYTYINSDGNTIIESGEIAKYGEGQLIDAKGGLYQVTSANDINDVTGCQSDLRDTDGSKLPLTGWIALIKRGSCNFEVKVKNVYSKGAVGAIIFNDKDSHTLDKMKINDKHRQIAAVFTTKKRGEEMEKLLREGYSLTVDITKGTTCTKALPNLNRTSVLFVSISFIVLMIISLVWLVFYYVQRFRYLQTKDKQSRRLCNVAKRIISKIPTKSIKSDDKEIDNDCCAICIELYKVTDLIRVLPCKHEFHKACIDPWLLEHRTCPMCKMDILKHYGFVFTGSQESILQLDMDAEEGDNDTISISSPRRDGVSPLPQIRSAEHQLSRSSSVDSDSERDIPTPNETTPSLGNWAAANQVTNKNDVCVGCIAAALSKHQHPDDVLETDFEQKYSNEMSGPSSLPSTLKKYKGHHSTGSCRGYSTHHNHSNQTTSICNEKEKRPRLVTSQSSDRTVDVEFLLPPRRDKQEDGQNKNKEEVSD